MSSASPGVDSVTVTVVPSEATTALRATPGNATAAAARTATAAMRVRLDMLLSLRGAPRLTG